MIPTASGIAMNRLELYDFIIGELYGDLEGNEEGMGNNVFICYFFKEDGEMELWSTDDVHNFIDMIMDYNVTQIDTTGFLLEQFNAIFGLISKIPIETQFF